MPLSSINGAQSPAIDTSLIDQARYTQFDPTQTVREPRQQMDGEMFMSLLVAQLTNQDPSSPMDTQEMVAQTTQLASMEQLTAMAKVQQEVFSLQQQLLTLDQRESAASMIGRIATTDGLDEEPVTGIVEAVTFSPDGEPMISIDGELHPLSSIAAVAAVADPED